MSRVALFILLLCSPLAFAQKFAPSAQDVDAIYPAAQATYVDLHEHPELSTHEIRTAQKMADALRKLGFEVTTEVGGTGVVGVLKNGPGPTVLIRTDMDALPVLERTGLSYASKVVAKDDSGHEVAVMHACGHDLHMSSWLGTATLLSQNKNRWRGTVVMMGQPAEEQVKGARAMLQDGLFTRFPKPNFAIAIHDSPDYAAGTVAIVSGAALASSDAIEITVFGKGGHGAYPNHTIDPVVISARIILALQTIVSRETSPFDPAVVTVGSIHGGTRGNIIPDEVKLQLTIRSYRDEVREHTMTAIRRICDAEATAAGAPRMPEITNPESVHSTYNDPVLSERLTAALTKSMGADHVLPGRPVMGAEDFSEIGRAGVPAIMIWVGAADPAKLAESQKTGIPLPPLHSSLFAPALPDALLTAIRAEATAAFELLGQP
ncbi:MAG: amidohydrolase [Terriglobia bacterium]|nr:amidohydrolase [Terriglobia bacterium]